MKNTVGCRSNKTFPNVKSFDFKPPAFTPKNLKFLVIIFAVFLFPLLAIFLAKNFIFFLRFLLEHCFVLLLEVSNFLEPCEKPIVQNFSHLFVLRVHV